ncbi:DUF7344 domain-containing protein [Natronorubrum sulfidifaciens]|uniref:DUF7344 domain-containing protein n=1 Tax=Natronorubrum sulfidifaciens JCM 14089 TaxID=1230460 RepID=L9W5K3_9EURY|nr:hypothetical protein [Natronorubrum sulfidifaciens]ELY44541.1 hypothetical protein C495_11589 [Natronorubrum sulfidifaciens JCM 14089]
MKSTYISSEQQGEADSSGESACAAEEPAFSKDEIFHLLQNERRRLVLRYLRDTDGPVRMRDIAEQVAAWEHETTVEALTSTQRQRVYIPLYQSHLSKLDKAGIIDYQQNRGIVVRKPLADQIDQYLQIEPSVDSTDKAESGTDWDDYYISATVLCYVVLIGAVIELPFLSLLSGIALSASILLLFTVLTISRLLN